MHAIAKLACAFALLIGLGGCATQSNAVMTPAAVRTAPDDYLVVAVRNDASSYSHAGSTVRNYGGGARYLESADARRTLQAIASDYRLQLVSGWPIPSLSLHCVIFKSLDGASRTELLARLQHDARVSLAQPLQSFTTNTTSSSNYNDPYVSMQDNLVRMGIPEAHRWSRGKGVRVALVDTGVDVTHPELQGRIIEQHNFVDRDGRQFSADRHGTAIAGIIAANANNGIGIVGIAPEIELYALKACWQLKADSDGASCNSFTLAQALARAIEVRANIINLSLVGPSDPLLTALIARAQAAGIVIVGAASSIDNFPAQVNNVIGAASMEDHALPPMRNVLYAPGRDVLTLLPANRYDFSSGNSIATAEITGTIALLLASAADDASAQLNAEQVRLVLSKASAATDGDYFNSVNACLALLQLSKQITCGGGDSTRLAQGH